MSRVRKFHLAFDQPAPSRPTVPDAETAALRMRLITEEYKEVHEDATRLLGLLRSGHGANHDAVVESMQRLVKEVCDLLYVTEGTLVAFGVYPAAYDAVHASNMSKLGDDGKPVRRADGKALKGPNYKPVNPEQMFPSIIDGTVEEV